MKTTRARAQVGLMALLLTGSVAACGDDDTSSGDAGGAGSEGAAADTPDPALEAEYEERHEALAALDWCTEIDADAISAITGPIDTTNSDEVSSPSQPACLFSAESAGYTVRMPLLPDLSGYREGESGLSEDPVDLDVLGNDAVYVLLPTDDGEVNTLNLYVQAEPTVVVQVEVRASVADGSEERDSDVALERAVEVAELALAVVEAN